jgi:hypothetical protein
MAIEKLKRRELDVLKCILKGMTCVPDMTKETEKSDRTLYDGASGLEKKGFIKNKGEHGKRANYVLVKSEVPRLVREVVKYVEDIGYDDISGTVNAEIIFKEILPMLNSLDRARDELKWWTNEYTGYVDFYKDPKVIEFLCNLYTSEFFNYEPPKEHEEIFRKIKKMFMMFKLSDFGKGKHDQEMYEYLVEKGLGPDS